MKDTDFIIKQGWMVTKLHLKGMSLELYALVYGYTKDGASWYETNIANIMEWLVASESTVHRHLRELVEAGYILRRQTGNGRSSKLLLQASQEILEDMEKGVNMTSLKRVPKTTEKGVNMTPIEGEKGVKNDITPYIRIKELKDNKRILLSAPARTKQEEDFLEIFFFRGAADPAAEVTDFVNWYETNFEEWPSIPHKKKCYYAAAWKINGGFRLCGRLWLAAWANVCNWIQENDPDNLRQMLDARFGDRCYRDSMKGQTVYELTMTREATDYLIAHKDELLVKYMSPLVKQHNAQAAKWRIIDNN